MPRPLIIVTNDDGIRSPGIVAAVRALRGLGEIVVVAPREQQSSAGRAFYWRERSARKYLFRVGRKVVPAWAVNSSPAVAVRYAIMLVAQRKPALLVSGVNYGENLGNGLTISGTVGAALEAAAEGIPALAVSLETEKQFHMTHSRKVDFTAAAHFTRELASRVLRGNLPDGVGLLNVNVPRDATRETPWRATRASRQSYFRSVVNRGRFVGYDVHVELESLEVDSDIHAIFVDHLVSVTPLTYDLTARVELPALQRILADAQP